MLVSELSQVLKLKELKELSLPMVAEELRQQPFLEMEKLESKLHTSISSTP